MQDYIDAAEAPPAVNSVPCQRPNLKRWDGSQRAMSAWDGIRGDPDLWIPNGDCNVYLYARGHSRRGPSLRVPMPLLQKSKCTPLVKMASLAQDSCGPLAPPTSFDLYLPAPSDVSKQETLRWHTTTRNFFAWLCQKPLVGEYLGQSLGDLLERMLLWRDPLADNIEDILLYTDTSGYSAVENCPEYALAMLKFSETFKLEHVWIDAFVHCVGMNGSLAPSSEFKSVSRVSKALITRASLEMDLHLSRGTKALNTFLEDEISAANLGLSDQARNHLDLFRSFLNSYHVGKHGYWPPPRSDQFLKNLYSSMYSEFSRLYDFLADKASLQEMMPWNSANGGICVVQNIDTFNKRQNLEPLPYQSPLLPQEKKATASHRSLRMLRMSFRENAPSHVEKKRGSLQLATNRDDSEVERDPLVQAYITFQDEYASQLDQQVSLADARRVQWILIYGILQTLISVLKAPPEVRNTELPNYPLCALTAGTPPWKRGHPERASAESSVYSKGSRSSAVHSLSGPEESPRPSIHPDCEGNDYYRSLWKDQEVTKTDHEIGDLKRPQSIFGSREGLKLLARPSRKLVKRPSLKVSSRVNSMAAPPSVHHIEEESDETLDSNLDSGIPPSPSDAETSAPEPEWQASELYNAIDDSPTASDGQMNFFEARQAVESIPPTDRSDSPSPPSLSFSHRSQDTSASSDADSPVSADFDHARVANIADQRTSWERQSEGVYRRQDSRGKDEHYIMQGPRSSWNIGSGDLPQSITKGYETVDFGKIPQSTSSAHAMSDSTRTSREENLNSINLAEQYQALLIN